MKKTTASELRFELTIATAQGEFVAVYSPHGLTEMSFPKNTPGLRRRQSIPAELLPQISKWHRITSKALGMILTGRKPVELPPLDIVDGTPFRRAVWRAMQAIPWGKTASYGDVAKTIRRPRAFRAVGSSCGANPIPVFIPCHRVLAANGRLGGFSSDPKWKRILLAAEGVELNPADRI